MSGRRIRVGVDTGGTFTDVVAVDEASGELVAVKTPSTPADPAEGFLTGIRKALAALKADMQAAVQALQQAREQPAQPRAPSAEQVSC